MSIHGCLKNKNANFIHIYKKRLFSHFQMKGERGAFLHALKSKAPTKNWLLKNRIIKNAGLCKIAIYLHLLVKYIYGYKRKNILIF